VSAANVDVVFQCGLALPILGHNVTMALYQIVFALHCTTTCIC